MRIKLKDDRRKKIEYQVKKMFWDDFEIELSDFQTEKIIDFFVKELGSPIYNQGIQDIKNFIQEKLQDLEGEVYASEK